MNQKVHVVCNFNCLIKVFSRSQVVACSTCGNILEMMQYRDVTTGH